MRKIVHPILLGSGRPLFPPNDTRRPLKLLGSKTYSTGLVSLTYEFARTGGPLTLFPDHG